MNNLIYILVAIFSFSIFTLLAYLFAINVLSKKKNNKLINMRNEFPFEVAPPLKSERAFLNVLLFSSFGGLIVSYILFAVKYLNFLPVFLVVLVTLLAFCLCAIPFIYIRYLREHLYLDIAIVAIFFFISGLLSYFSFSVMKLTNFTNPNPIISFVMSILFLITSLLFVLNPRLFNLNNEVNEESNTRRKTIPLCVCEWTILLSSNLLVVPLILLATVL